MTDELAKKVTNIIHRLREDSGTSSVEIAATVLVAVTPAIEARAKLEGAKAMQNAAVKAASWAHMVPPDGGQPSEAECEVARAAAESIAALDPAQIVKEQPLPHGTLVRKREGHEFEGHFLVEYTDMKGRIWWMVELNTPGAKGLMFHFRREQMEALDPAQIAGGGK